MAFFSLEMSSEQLATRLLGEHAQVPSDKIRRGEIKSEDFYEISRSDAKFCRVCRFISTTHRLFRSPPCAPVRAA